MMLWRNPHRRFQERLSDYLDGGLTSNQARAVASHLDSCDSCSQELADLRLTVAALAELPHVDVPRSFALTPELIRPPAVAPARGSVRTVNSGLRLTGGALAAVLALVLVLDAGGIVGNGGGENAGGGFESLRGNAPGPVPTAGAPASTGEMSAQGGGVAAVTPAPDEGQLPPEATGRAAADQLGETPTPSPTGVNGNAAAAARGTNGPEEEDNRAFESAGSNEDSDDGFSALTVTEIVLAALLGASIIGIVAATFVERRRS